LRIDTTVGAERICIDLQISPPLSLPDMPSLSFLQASLPPLAASVVSRPQRRILRILNMLASARNGSLSVVGSSSEDTWALGARIPSNLPSRSTYIHQNYYPTIPDNQSDDIRTTVSSTQTFTRPPVVTSSPKFCIPEAFEQIPTPFGTHPTLGSSPLFISELRIFGIH